MKNGVMMCNISKKLFGDGYKPKQGLTGLDTWDITPVMPLHLKGNRTLQQMLENQVYSIVRNASGLTGTTLKSDEELFDLQLEVVVKFFEIMSQINGVCVESSFYPFFMLPCSDNDGSYLGNVHTTRPRRIGIVEWEPVAEDGGIDDYALLQQCILDRLVWCVTRYIGKADTTIFVHTPLIIADPVFDEENGRCYRSIITKFAIVDSNDISRYGSDNDVDGMVNIIDKSQYKWMGDIICPALQ